MLNYKLRVKLYIVLAQVLSCKIVWNEEFAILIDSWNSTKFLWVAVPKTIYLYFKIYIYIGILVVQVLMSHLNKSLSIQNGLYVRKDPKKDVFLLGMK